MSTEPKPTGMSPLSGLIKMMGILHREDPFGHLLVAEGADSGWFRAVIDLCLEKETCLFCEVSRSCLSDYLFWLPVNLRDADFFQSLYVRGGFCPSHLKSVMFSLRDFPYGQVRFFILLRQLLGKGIFPSKHHCHLCATLEESREAYKSALNGLLNSPEKSREAKTLVFNLCSRHARYVNNEDRKKRMGLGGEKSVSAEEKRSWGAALSKTIDEISEGFHRMSSGELRRRLRECESMVLQAINERGQ